MECGGLPPLSPLKHHHPIQPTTPAPAQNAGARGPRCLVFECGAAVRRVWHYPSDWGEWDAEKLEVLSWQT